MQKRRANNGAASSPLRKKSWAALVPLVVLVCVSVGLSGCFKKWDMEEVKEWYEEKPKDFDDYMRVAREKAGLGQSDRAMKLYADCIADLEAQFGREDVRIATPAEELGVMQEKLGMLQESEASYRKALDVRMHSLPANHLDVKRSRQKLSAILKRLGKNDEARDVLAGVTAKKDSSNSSSGKSTVRVRRHKRPASDG